MEYLVYAFFAYVISHGVYVLSLKDQNTIIHECGLKHSRQ